MKYLDHTQRIIQRFTVQSFAIKGFSLTFLGLIANLIKDVSNIYVLLASLSGILIFYFLDAFYLRMERIYRKVEEQYDENKGLNYKNYKINEPLCSAIFSKTIFLLYLIEIILLIVIYLAVVEII